jgi:acyl-CoA synthetase (AMP-forming)/AMP-acid ligase II
MTSFAVAQAAGLLAAHGVSPGDRVGMRLPNVAYFPIIYWAVLRIGAVVVPMNPLLKATEVAYHLADSGTKLMLGWHGFAGAATAGRAEAGAECILVEPRVFDELLAGATPVDDVVDRGDDDPAVIIYTSGTTGQPKGATLTHANLRAGAEVIQHDRDRYDTSSLQLCVSGGSAMPAKVLNGFDEAFGAKVLEGYGLSETTGIASFNTRDRPTKFPLANAAIVMRGPFVVPGYWNRADATETVMNGGWLHTSDIATIDDRNPQL